MALLYLGHRAARIAVVAVALALVLVVGADRILLGVHNLSDVLAGYAVGAFWVLAMLAQYPPEVPDRGVPGSRRSSGPSDQTHRGPSAGSGGAAHADTVSR
jgi:membrane-associated phospholipid phosphatase